VAVHQNAVSIPAASQYLLNRLCLGFAHSPD
jgi:hypothetical protein